MPPSIEEGGMEMSRLQMTVTTPPPTGPPSGATEEVAKKAETDLPQAYIDYLDQMQKAWGDLPDLTITYQDFGYNVQVPADPNAIPTMPTAIRDGILGLNPFRDTSKETKTFKPIQGANGIVRPGELTLVLAPPGHGKSVLLRGLAGRLEREPKNLRGEIRWNGLDAKQSAEAGQQLTKMCAFVEQGDVHYPMLTVRETFQFALDNSNADTTLLGSPEFTALQEKKVELMLELLGLKECADTVVGNYSMRGVSGGQKKRVTLGEMMITQARALFLDEISTGLDAAATFDIVSALKKWTRVMRGSAYVALLQPAPEVFDMFDQLVLMREGCIVFSGTQAELKQHLADCNITPSNEIDFADWLVEFLTDPPAIWQRDIQRASHVNPVASFRKSFREEHAHDGETDASTPTVTDAVHSPDALAVPPPISADAHPREVIFHIDDDEADSSTPSTPSTSEVAEGQATKPVEVRVAAGAKRVKGLGQVITSQGIPLTTSALKKAYESSAAFQNIQTEMRDTAYTLEKKYLGGADRVEPSPFTKAQFYQPQSWGVWHHTKACLWRQWLFMLRSPDFVYPRVGQAIVMGLIMGSVYYKLGGTSTEVGSRIGLIVNSLIFVSFANMVEVPLACEFKLVVYKQLDAGFYSTFSYIFSVVLMHMPLAMAETFIFASCLYWLSGFAVDAGRYFFYLLLVLGGNLCISTIFRFISYMTRHAGVASTLAVPTNGVGLLLGGFLITYHKIPNWLVEFFWLSPFAWGLRSGALNEFESDRYAPGVGASYMDTWQINTRSAYKWAGIGYQWGIFILFIFLGAAALSYKRIPLTTGTRRTDEHEQDANDIEVRVGVPVGSKDALATETTLAPGAITFTQMDLAFIDLKYTVPVFEKNDETGLYEHKQRMLLTGINGYARAGELTALMGSSGAGKTTLMDVIAGRKTAGTIEGQILIDGHPQTFPSFNRLMGYCEQVDIHVGTDTVREAIEFSARLRLPPEVSAEARQQFVEQILDDLELTPIANRLIGDMNIPGLSPGQLKRVTIGVELAANPTFLFLDEPTSGLDSRAALIVCRVIRKIARRGRAVICTIHQPSAELFGMFDRLLLLKSGGKEVYFGPIGEDGVNVVQYFMNADIGPEFYRPSLPDKVNPASWMLDVVGAGTSAKGKIAEYNSVYQASALREENMAAVRRFATPKDGSVPVSFSSPYAAPYRIQVLAVLTRLFTAYWRDVSSTGTRFANMLFLTLFFGLVYRDIGDDDEAGMTSKMSIIFQGLGWHGTMQSAQSLPIVLRLREIFYRERASSTYAPWVFSTTLALVELPYVFVATLVFVLPLYFLVGFASSGTLFWLYVLALFLDAVFFAYMGQFIGALMPGMDSAQLLQGFIVALYFLFGGVYIRKSAIPTGWQFLYYMNPMAKGLVAITIEQYQHLRDCAATDVTGECTRFVASAMDDQLVTKWEFASWYIASGTGWDKYYLAYYLLMIFAMLIFFILTVQKVSHLKR